MRSAVMVILGMLMGGTFLVEDVVVLVAFAAAPLRALPLSHGLVFRGAGRRGFND
jgi:hypothetical protein